MKVLFLLVLAFCISTTSSASPFRRLIDTKRLKWNPDIIISPTPKACPCSDVSLCNPVQVQHPTEIFGFQGNTGSWQYYPFDVITTIAWGVNDPNLLCTAHKNNVRLIAPAPDNIPLTSNATLRQNYIQTAIQMVKDNYLDGITFDYESPIAWNAPERDYYTQLVTEATTAFHTAIPGSQISVCVAWSPDDIDGRAYDYPGLANGSDLLYVMSYDTRSQVFDQCIASANTPFGIAQRGIQRYIDMGIPKDKLILGLPWYGYQYICLSPTQRTDNYCPIEYVPFRGVNCSDSAGSQLPFYSIMKLVDSGAALNGGVHWDSNTQTPYFNFLGPDPLAVYQMWFDNATSLALKYNIAKDFGLRGVGPYTYADVDTTGSKSGNPKAPAEAKEMWDALRAFKQTAQLLKDRK